MSSNWIKWCKGLAKKREILVLASRLNRDRHEIAGRLMVLWEWCDENMDDADFDGEDAILSLSDRDTIGNIIDTETGLPGFCDALQDPAVAWLEIREGLAVFKKLRRNNGKTAKERASENRKKANQRKNGKPGDDFVPVASGHLPGHLPGPDKSRAEQSRLEQSRLETVDASETANAPRKDRRMQGGKVLEEISKPEISNGENSEHGKNGGQQFGAIAREGNNSEPPPAKIPDPGRESEIIPHGFANLVWDFWSICEVSDRPDQKGFFATLAWADCLGFAWPRPILDIVGRAKRARSPAAQVTHVLKTELGKTGWSNFKAATPSYTHCLWALEEIDLGRRKEGTDD